MPIRENQQGLFNINIDNALKTGLKFRPLSETLTAILEWNKQRNSPPLKVGMDHNREQELLRLWENRLCPSTN